MSTPRCGSTETETGEPCQFPSAENCPHHPTEVPESSGSEGSDDRPAGNWEARVHAAYCRMCGKTQEETAQRVGFTARTIRNWEAADSWSDACDEARDRWMQDLIVEARSAVLQAVKNGDMIRGLQILERVDDELAPPAHQVEHSGPEGGPIETADRTAEQVEQKMRELLEAGEIGDEELEVLHKFGDLMPAVVASGSTNGHP